MLAAERHQKIAELVNKNSVVRVTELSNLFSVTEETIRRDLEKLEKDNKLRRSHGGAVKIQQAESEIHFSEREITNVKEKKAIALEAIKKVEEGDRIMIDASTTAWYMARSLPNIHLTVITNSIRAAVELSKKDRIEVISTGGTLLSKSLSYVGPLAERSLEQYHVNKTFISCTGIHLDTGISDSLELQALLKKRMLQHSDRNILMVDSSKFGTHAFSFIAPLYKFDEIITDRNIDQHSIQILKEKNIKATIADYEKQLMI